HATFQQYQDKLWQLVRRYHAAHPLRLGLSREEARSRLQLTAVLFEALIETSDLMAEGAVVRDSDHAVQFSPQQEAQIEAFLAQVAAAGIETPSVKEAVTAVGEEVYYALVDLGRLVPLNDTVLYTPDALAGYTNQIVALARQNGQITAGEVRDLFDTSRKYTIALLEYLDQQKITRRVGDARVLLS
ncbi:MAG: SelB C-terminal domain-containing protein, partial [Anaerolineales bacterium]|nr:SelB C-terminal domain-containing protein [Anaerolineales bacterium]